MVLGFGLYPLPLLLAQDYLLAECVCFRTAGRDEGGEACERTCE